VRVHASVCVVEREWTSSIISRCQFTGDTAGTVH